MNTRILLVLSLLCLAAGLAEARSGRYRAMWREDPATTMVIGWEQFSGEDPRLYYRPAGQPDAPWSSRQPDRQVTVRQMDTRFVRLSGLAPDTRYQCYIRDSEGKSAVLFFHTAPDRPDVPMTFICGGDSRNNRGVRQRINALAAGFQPLAIFFSGDMTDWATVKEWKEWLDDWQRTITADGRLIPILAARGNHEPSNDLLTDLFDVPHPEVYYALGFGGDLLRVYTLNSMIPAGGAQARWLEEDLKREGAHYQWRMAQYHLPMRPHHRRKRPHTAAYQHWAGLFYRHRVQLVQESDAHLAKLTWPLRPYMGSGSHEGFIRDDARGTVYIGEGGWGAPLRHADDKKPWTRQSGSFHQFNWIRVSADALEVRVVDADASRQARPLASLSRGELPAGARFWKIGREDLLVLRGESRKSPESLWGKAERFPVIPLDDKERLEVPYRLRGPSEVEVRYLLPGQTGVLYSETSQREAGLHRHFLAVGQLPEGRYLLEVLADGQPILQRWMERGGG
jgi:acid phosphatase type 7